MSRQELNELRRLEDLERRANKGRKPNAAPQSIARTALDQGMQGATFGFADEAMDAIGALGAGTFMKAFRPDLMEGQNLDTLYKEARGNTKARLEEQVEQNPGT